MTPLLSVRDLAVSCGIKGQGSGRRTIFSGVSLTVESGKLVAVVGANGSGKSGSQGCTAGMTIRRTDTQGNFHTVFFFST